jgi:acyl-coenzyme A thioesterase PaaI-like protein
MSTSQQEDVTRQVLRSVRDFLGGPTPANREWSFEYAEHLHSNWGAVYGGALAASTLAVARSAAPDRSPRSLHIQIVRSVPSGTAYATAEVRHAGRTVATVQVDLFDARRKLATTALITMVTPDALATDSHNTTANRFDRRPRPTELKSGFVAPVQQSLQMLTDEHDGTFVGWFADNGRSSIDGQAPPVGHVTLPWDNLESTGPEAACLGSDAMIATPLLYSSIPTEVIGPNPDLSLRFTTAPAQREVLTAGTMLSVQNGTATVALEVQAGDNQLAHGLATSLLLRSS